MTLWQKKKNKERNSSSSSSLHKCHLLYISFYYYIFYSISHSSNIYKSFWRIYEKKAWLYINFRSDFYITSVVVWFFTIFRVCDEVYHHRLIYPSTTTTTSIWQRYCFFSQDFFRKQLYICDDVERKQYYYKAVPFYTGFF